MDQPIDQENLTKKQRREFKRQEKLQHRQQEATQGRFMKIGLWVLIVAVIAGGTWWLVTAAGDQEPLPTVTALTVDDWVEGSRDAAVVLIEYSDFQCPACAATYQNVKQIREEFGDQIAVAFRHFPLRSIHPNAQLAAQAAEAAGTQGKFWEMHDVLFEKQDEWSNMDNPANTFAAYATTLGLNAEQFNADLNAAVAADAVQEDYNSGTAAGVRGTPTFYLNGEQMTTPRSLDAWKEKINEALGTGT